MKTRFLSMLLAIALLATLAACGNSTTPSGSLGYSCNSVNGYMVNDGYLNCDVANGKKGQRRNQVQLRHSDALWNRRDRRQGDRF